MGWLDNLQGNIDGIAGKVGMTPDQVQALTNTLQSKLSAAGGDQLAALQQTAAQHGIPVDKVQEILGHAGAGSDLAGEAAGLAKGLFNR